MFENQANNAKKTTNKLHSSQHGSEEFLKNAHLGNWNFQFSGRDIAAIVLVLDQPGRLSVLNAARASVLQPKPFVRSRLLAGL